MLKNNDWTSVQVIKKTYGLLETIIVPTQAGFNYERSCNFIELVRLHCDGISTTPIEIYDIKIQERFRFGLGKIRPFGVPGHKVAS